MHQKVFLRHIPRHVRLVEADGEEERPVVRLAQFRDAEIGNGGVRDRGVVLALDRAKGDAADAAVVDLRLDLLLAGDRRPLRG
ncbi:MAG: hypothetical protein R3F11_19390 [Verrucomicrobiales bacterium]